MSNPDQSLGEILSAAAEIFLPGSTTTAVTVQVPTPAQNNLKLQTDLNTGRLSRAVPPKPWPGEEPKTQNRKARKLVMKTYDDEETNEESEDDGEKLLRKLPAKSKSYTELEAEKAAAGIQKNPKVGFKSFTDTLEMAREQSLVKARPLPEWTQAFNVNAHHDDAFYPILVDLRSERTLSEITKKLEEQRLNEENRNRPRLFLSAFNETGAAREVHLDGLLNASNRLSFLTASVMKGFLMSPISRAELDYLYEEVVHKFGMDTSWFSSTKDPSAVKCSLEERRVVEDLMVNVRYARTRSRDHHLHSICNDFGYSNGDRIRPLPKTSKSIETRSKMLDYFYEFDTYIEIPSSVMSCDYTPESLFNGREICLMPLVSNFKSHLAEDKLATCGPRYSPEWENRRLDQETSFVVVWVPREQFITPREGANPLTGVSQYLRAGIATGAFLPENDQTANPVSRADAAAFIEKVYSENVSWTRRLNFELEGVNVIKDMADTMLPEEIGLLQENVTTKPFLFVDCGALDPIVQSFGAEFCALFNSPVRDRTFPMYFNRSTTNDDHRKKRNVVFPIQPLRDYVYRNDGMLKISWKTYQDNDTSKGYTEVEDELVRSLGIKSTDEVKTENTFNLDAWTASFDDPCFDVEHVVFIDDHHRQDRLSAIRAALGSVGVTFDPEILLDFLVRVCIGSAPDFLIAFTGRNAGVQSFDYLLRHYFAGNLTAPKSVGSFLHMIGRRGLADNQDRARGLALIEAVEALPRSAGLVDPTAILSPGECAVNPLNTVGMSPRKGKPAPAAKKKPRPRDDEDDEEEEEEESKKDDDEEDENFQETPATERVLRETRNDDQDDKEKLRAEYLDLLSLLSQQDQTSKLGCLVSAERRNLVVAAGIENVSEFAYMKTGDSIYSNLFTAQNLDYERVSVINRATATKLSASSKKAQERLLAGSKDQLSTSETVSKRVKTAAETLRALEQARGEVRKQMERYQVHLEDLREGILIRSGRSLRIFTPEKLRKELEAFPFIQSLRVVGDTVYLVMQPAIVTLESAEAFWEVKRVQGYGEFVEKWAAAVQSSWPCGSAEKAAIQKVILKSEQFKHLATKYGTRLPDEKIHIADRDDEVHRFLQLAIRDAGFQRYVPAMSMGLTVKDVYEKSDTTNPVKLSMFGIGVGIRDFEESHAEQLNELKLSPEIYGVLEPLYTKWRNTLQPKVTGSSSKKMDALESWKEEYQKLKSTPYGSIISTELTTAGFDRFVQGKPLTPHLKISGNSCWSSFKDAINLSLRKRRHLEAMLLCRDFFTSATDNVTGIPGLLEMPTKEPSIKFVSNRVSF
jgi:hypothetical protein